MTTPSQPAARKAAKHYLESKLGDRRGCKVLEGLEVKFRREIIDECTEAFREFSNKQCQDTAAALAEAIEALREIEDVPAVPFKLDQLEHATLTIERMQEIARAFLQKHATREGL